jgi:hypothetical protein
VVHQDDTEAELYQCNPKKEWNDFGKRAHERIVQGLMQDKDLKREQAEKLYNELPI